LSQEELAAVKLREAEANLALKDLKAKVSELSGMWQKHLKRSEAAKLEAGEAPPSTPKKLFGCQYNKTGSVTSASPK
jgi:hypothetical protein